MSYHEIKRCVWHAKIFMGQSRSEATCVYYRNMMEPEFALRWNWYFKYRAALLQVQNPKMYVELTTGGDWIDDDQGRINYRNKVIAKKAKITTYKNRLKEIESTWNELFPIKEDPKYINTIAIIEKEEKTLQEMEKALADGTGKYMPHKEIFIDLGRKHKSYPPKD